MITGRSRDVRISVPSPPLSISALVKVCHHDTFPHQGCAATKKQPVTSALRVGLTCTHGRWWFWSCFVLTSLGEMELHWWGNFKKSFHYLIIDMIKIALLVYIEFRIFFGQDFQTYPWDPNTLKGHLPIYRHNLKGTHEHMTFNWCLFPFFWQTIRMFKGGKELEDYEGNRSSSSLVDFAKQHEILVEIWAGLSSLSVWLLLSHWWGSGSRFRVLIKIFLLFKEMNTILFPNPSQQLVMAISVVWV